MQAVPTLGSSFGLFGALGYGVALVYVGHCMPEMIVLLTDGNSNCSICGRDVGFSCS